VYWLLAGCNVDTVVERSSHEDNGTGTSAVVHAHTVEGRYEGTENV
jgi:hypothetical protein